MAQFTPPHIPTIEQIIAATLKVFDMPRDDLHASVYLHRSVLARAAIIAVGRKMTVRSCHELGFPFGYRGGSGAEWRLKSRREAQRGEPKRTFHVDGQARDLFDCIDAITALLTNPERA
jgi:hypothetical protein